MDFKRRNEIRAEQLAFKWYREIGDRVQLVEGAGGYPAWSSGTLIAINHARSNVDVEFTLYSVRMDDGGILEETLVETPARAMVEPKLYLVPHEDYFLTDEDKKA